MKSRSAIMTAPGEPLLIDEIDVPDPGPNQVIVKQTATGICASQIHELTKIPEESCPCVLGHEGVGVVTHVGKDVTHLQEGDWAITTWVPRGGFPGRDFIEGLAPIGTTFQDKLLGGPIGTFTEHCLASDQLAVKIAPEHASPESSIVGCAVLTGGGADPAHRQGAGRGIRGGGRRRRYRLIRPQDGVAGAGLPGYCRRPGR